MLLTVEQALTNVSQRLTTVEQQLTANPLPSNADQNTVEQRLTSVEQCLTTVQRCITDVEQRLTVVPLPVLPSEQSRLEAPEPTVPPGDREDDLHGAEFEPWPEPAIGEAESVSVDDVPPTAGGTVPNGEGLTLQEICRQFGISFKNLSRNAKTKGQTIVAYLTEQTGVTWVQRGKRYHRLE